MRLAACLALLLLAGCTGPSGPDAADATFTSSAEGPGMSLPPPPEPLPPEPMLSHVDCRQYHSFFAFPQALLEGVQPEGFTLQPSLVGPGLTDVYVHWEFCASGNATLASQVPLDHPSQFYAAVQVTPPTEVGEPPLLDLYPIAWLASEPILGWLAAHNASNTHAGTVTWQGSIPAPGIVADALDAATSWGAFHSDTVVQEGGAPFPASMYRMWAATNGVATGFFETRMTEAPTVGTGAVGMGYHGDPLYGPPPNSEGLVHVVEGISTVTTFVAL